MTIKTKFNLYGLYDGQWLFIVGSNDIAVIKDALEEDYDSMPTTRASMYRIDTIERCTINRKEALEFLEAKGDNAPLC